MAVMEKRGNHLCRLLPQYALQLSVSVENNGVLLLWLGFVHHVFNVFCFILATCNENDGLHKSMHFWTPH